MTRSASSFTFTLASWLQAVEAGEQESARLIAQKLETDAPRLDVTQQLKSCFSRHFQGTPVAQLVEQVMESVRCVTESQLQLGSPEAS